MHVKVGDTVKVISGNDKGKTGEVTSVIKHNSTIVIKEINLKTKHVKSKEEGEPGQIIKVICSSLISCLPVICFVHLFVECTKNDQSSVKLELYLLSNYAVLL